MKLFIETVGRMKIVTIVGSIENKDKQYLANTLKSLATFYPWYYSSNTFIHFNGFVEALTNYEVDIQTLLHKGIS